VFLLVELDFDFSRFFSPTSPLFRCSPFSFCARIGACPVPWRPPWTLKGRPPFPYLFKNLRDFDQGLQLIAFARPSDQICLKAPWSCFFGGPPPSGGDIGVHDAHRSVCFFLILMSRPLFVSLLDSFFSAAYDPLFSHALARHPCLPCRRPASPPPSHRVLVFKQRR